MSIELDMINAMLATTGALALSAADERHPNYITAKNVLNRVVDEVFSKRYWFNTSVRTLLQDENGKVRIPAGAIAVDPTSREKHYVAREEYLFDAEAQTFRLNEDVECWVVMGFDNLPDVPVAALNYLRACCRYEFYLDGEGDQLKLRGYMEKKLDMEREFLIEAAKQESQNFFDSPAHINFRARRYGYSGYPRFLNKSHLKNSLY